ncbi:hypothetical protein B0T24DRAFT_653312 [Lasiosphaeria ovina]|uniref:Uncharacterized protein n=1 Tax=Lasiosphaeria ovina TaxID=92902 RepID=A0AAE0NIF5_9PEZI|nr:hypothetical protein B0T24DRAFT_653312 [Lasiosphaeria ovina]
MLQTWRTLAAFGLLVQSAKGRRNDVDAQVISTTIFDPVCTANVTVYDTTSVKITHYVDVVCTVNITTTNTVSTYIIEDITTTLLYSVSVTETDSATTTTTEVDSVTITNTEKDWVTVTNTATSSTTVTNTETDSVTITNTETTTSTVPATITTYTTTTRTIFSTTVDPCPSSCSISVETVNLYFWPTDRPATYPSTYVDHDVGYTFTWPSVYMFIPTAVGINTEGETVGPSTASWMLPLNLNEVSTIAQGSSNITRQLTLSDLGTDCPRTADPSAIATMVDAHCDPVLAAPSQVRSWAYPCNACGRFGLFDPPYALPTVTGGLIPPTTTVLLIPPTTTVLPPPETITAVPPIPTPTTPPAPQMGVLLIVYFTVTGISGTVTSSVFAPRTSTTSPIIDTTSDSTVPTTAAPSIVSSSGLVSPISTSVVTASASRYAAPERLGMWLIPSVLITFCWL